MARILPPAQGVHSHAPEPELTEPGAQGVGVTEPVEQALPGGHAEHCDWAERLVAELKLPFSHGSGADAPTGHTEPASHGKHLLDIACG